MTALPTRQQIDRAAPLDFEQTRTEKHANITIELAPDGLHVRCEYTGPLSSISAAIDRLRAAGIVELVNTSRVASAPGATVARQKAAERVEPLYQPDGTACCPVHHKALASGQYGAYCSAKAKPGEVANKNGYCGLKFNT